MKPCDRTRAASRALPATPPPLQAAIFRTVEAGGQFVLLGSGHSDPVFRQLADGQFRDHPNCRCGVLSRARAVGCGMEAEVGAPTHCTHWLREGREWRGCVRDHPKRWWACGV